MARLLTNNFIWRGKITTGYPVEPGLMERQLLNVKKGVGTFGTASIRPLTTVSLTTVSLTTVSLTTSWWGVQGACTLVRELRKKASYWSLQYFF